MNRKYLSLPLCLLVTAIQFSTPLAGSAADASTSTSWKDDAISPVTNPLFFEDPIIRSEIRPIFAWHDIDKSFITGGGDVQVYAAQLRWAPTDRLAIIATKDGYIDFHPKGVLKHESGFANIGAGVKYALIDSEENQFILTPGLKIELPTGSKKVFQGTGSGEWDIFVSSEKGWGKFHATGTVGVRVPNDMDAQTTQTHYSLQFDYRVCRYFTPFAAANAFTILTNGKQLPLNVEGYDLLNFGSSNAAGGTQAVVGGGFRSQLLDKLDLGFAYEAGVTHPKGLFDDRFTVDLIYRF